MLELCTFKGRGHIFRLADAISEESGREGVLGRLGSGWSKAHGGAQAGGGSSEETPPSFHQTANLSAAPTTEHNYLLCGLQEQVVKSLNLPRGGKPT